MSDHHHTHLLVEHKLLAGEVFGWLDGLLSNVKSTALAALIVVGLVFAVIQFVRGSGVLRRAAMVLVATGLLYLLAHNITAVGDALGTEIPFLKK